MSVLAISISTVTLAEIGDKTQLLSLALATRFRKPAVIIFAIFVATLVNHAIAAWLGVVAADILTDTVLHIVLIISFGVMAVWMLIPDKLEEEGIQGKSAFWASFSAFFVAEIGDKTQIATTALGAQFNDALWIVVIGSTIGMLLANVPVVLAGDRIQRHVPFAVVRALAAAMFAALAVLDTWYLLS
ncbi:TMEM165/GDT1 family protein [Salinivibrio costicola]|uniref:GDT1 family protein n=1 Tax=Salinivibrio costicola TaxID=51367 RepID=A0ABX6K490_SALCS|nr:TMEM165/GDT1 family protein [Salinivibrio costicola]QIR04911.1 TMEM165/GDT1 family protein [Salinivibrio costicola]